MRQFYMFACLPKLQNYIEVALGNKLYVAE